MIVLDTHVLVWADNMGSRLGRRSRRLIEMHWAEGRVACCALTFWEAAQLELGMRLKLPLPAPQWRATLLAGGLEEDRRPRRPGPMSGARRKSKGALGRLCCIAPAAWVARVRSGGGCRHRTSCRC